MSLSEISAAEIVAKTRLFSNVSEPWRVLVGSAARRVVFSKGQTVFTHDEPCPGVYCVGSGLVRLFKISASGKELVLHMAAPGDTFAEVAAIAGFPVPADAEAVEDTVCALIPTDRLRAMLEEHHALCLEFLTGMSFWVRQLVGMLEDIVLRDASGRVARHLLDADPSAGRAAFQLKVLKKDLASHLNITSETLSRTLRRLAESRLIELEAGQRLRVLDTERLRALARGYEEP